MLLGTQVFISVLSINHINTQVTVYPKYSRKNDETTAKQITQQAASAGTRGGS